MRQDFPGMTGLRRTEERDMRESDEQLLRSRGALDKTWQMLCVKCGKTYMSEPVPKCCINKLKGPCCLGE